MPRFLPEEVVAKVRELYEGMPLTHARIAVAAGVGESTVSVLAQKNGWTRCPEARTSRRLSHDQCEAILRLREAGASARAVAAAAGCHARTVGRIAPPERRTAASGTVAAPWPGAAQAGALPVPEHFADLHAALMSPGLRKAEAAPLLVRAAAALGAEALVRQDLGRRAHRAGPRAPRRSGRGAARPGSLCRRRRRCVPGAGDLRGDERAARGAGAPLRATSAWRGTPRRRASRSVKVDGRPRWQIRPVRCRNRSHIVNRGHA